MLRHCLVFKEVILPGAPSGWPTPMNLSVALNEVMLLEGLKPGDGDEFLRVASTLEAPMEGQVWHWGMEAVNLAREDLYDLRRRIAYISSRQVLLNILTLGDNIALGPRYHTGYSFSEAISRNAGLLEQLELWPSLKRLPFQVEREVYMRAIWARELVKSPELILAVIEEPFESDTAQKKLVSLLQDYLAQNGGALLLLGSSLKNFYSMAHCALRLESGRLIPHRFLEHKGRSLAAFLPLA